VFGPRSGAERLNAKNNWEEDHNAAILEEIGGREGLDHDEEASIINDASLEMDHHHHHHYQKRMAAIKSRIVSSHRN
jgi:hypothetical protein